MEAVPDMREFLKCVLYLAAIGFAFFLFGRILPKKMFEHDALPFQLFRFEKGGRIYDALHIRKWKDGFPDMSVLLPALIPSKKLPKVLTTAQIESMIQETCVAEWIHELLCLFGFGCVFLWEGVGGWLVSALYVLGNLPYIIIQRYNRPKFVRLLKKLQAKEAGCENRKQDHIRGKGTYTELQYGARP